jgi:hypothetical protein
VEGFSVVRRQICDIHPVQKGQSKAHVARDPDGQLDADLYRIPISVFDMGVRSLRCWSFFEALFDCTFFITPLTARCMARGWQLNLLNTDIGSVQDLSIQHCTRWRLRDLSDPSNKLSMVEPDAHTSRLQKAGEFLNQPRPI